MKPISESVYGKLMAQGLRAGSVGAGRARKLGKGPDHEGPASFQGGGVKTPGRNETHCFDYVVHTNHAVPTSTRKTAGRKASAAFLMVVVGGRA